MLCCLFIKTSNHECLTSEYCRENVMFLLFYLKCKLKAVYNLSIIIKIKKRKAKIKSLILFYMF